MTSPIGKLILVLKGDRSYEQLSKDCGGSPTSGRIQQLASRQQNTFPSPESIRGLAKGLGVKPYIIVQAVGASLDLWDENEPTGNAMALPEGAEHLTTGQHSAVVSMIRELVKGNEVSDSLRNEIEKLRGDGEAHAA